MREEIKAQLEADICEPIVDWGYGSGVILSASGRAFYLKTGFPSLTYQCEANGLRELANSGTINVAKIVSVGENYIVTKYVPVGSPSGGFFERFGCDLARMHRTIAPEFGFYEDNFIGANPQENTPANAEATDWCEFYFNKRLLSQFRLAERNGYATPSMARAFSGLESRIKAILIGSEEPPTLLHGDLWAGNFICNENNEAILIDPAVYYGHREADLAMTKLFGGFPPAFYRAYQTEFPLKPGWERREPLYRLYHIMNHLNMFGRGYLRETELIMGCYVK